LKASYTSTGAGGTDYEADVAAALLARLLAGGTDRMLPHGLEAGRVSLQQRSGPLGFDDFTVEGRLQDGTSAVAYLQAKRTYSLGDTKDFRELVLSLWTHVKTDQGAWTETIIAGIIAPDLDDVDTLLESARAQNHWETFENVWSQNGVLNDGKRTFLARSARHWKMRQRTRPTRCCAVCGLSSRILPFLRRSPAKPLSTCSQARSRTRLLRRAFCPN